MPRVDVDPTTFTAASATFGDTIASALSRTYSTLLDGLHNSTSMAGSDTTAQQWSSSYDDAARGAASGSESVINACYSLAALLEANGFNHGTANAASTPGAPAPTFDTYNWAGRSISLPAPPSAYGGSGSPPHGWSLIEPWLAGHVWPNGHQDKLHAAAAAWSQAARSVTAIAYDIAGAVSAIQSQVSPEVDAAVTECQAMDGHLAALSATYNDLSTSCTQYAHGLDQAHNDIKNELVSLVEWTVAIESGGALLGAVTLGIGEAAAQAAEAGRLAATAARIVSIIERVKSVVTTILDLVKSIPGRIGELIAKLKPLIDAVARRIAGRSVQGETEVAKADETAEEMATEALANSAADALATQRASLAKAISHLDDIGMMDHPPNAAMINRIEGALSEGRALTTGEQNFLTHEVAEAEAMSQGASLDAAHELALQTHPLFQNFDPDVIQEFPEYFNSNWKQAWGLS